VTIYISVISPGPGSRAQAAAERKGPLTTSVRPRASTPRTPLPVSPVRPDAEETLRLVLTHLDEMKAEDTTTLDLRRKSSFADYMVVTSGRSNRHVGSVADRVMEKLRNAGLSVRVEGMPHCDWVLIDAGDVIVNVFRPEVRAFYNLEKMWAGRQGDERRAG
jgi:ribosome-associated protein